MPTSIVLWCLGYWRNLIKKPRAYNPKIVGFIEGNPNKDPRLLNPVPTLSGALCLRFRVRVSGGFRRSAALVLILKVWEPETPKRNSKNLQKHPKAMRKALEALALRRCAKTPKNRRCPKGMTTQRSSLNNTSWPSFRSTGKSRGSFIMSRRRRLGSC